jgi:hypothetical protein
VRKKKKKRKEKNQGKKKKGKKKKRAGGKKKTSDAGFGRNKRRKVGLVIIVCSCVYLVFAITEQQQLSLWNKNILNSISL